MTNKIYLIFKITNKIMLAAVITASIAFLIMFLYVAFNRLFYPYDLDWIEGAMVDPVNRIVYGLPLYCEPTLEYTPHVYTPLFFYFSALLSLVTGMGFVPLRLLSIICTLISMVIAGGFVFRETRSWLSSIVTVGVFAASYSMTTFWFDLGRVDNLMLMFLLGAVYLVRFHKSYKGMIVSGILFVLAFLSKQQVTFAFISMFLYVLLVDWRKSIVLFASVLLLIILSIITLNGIYNNWFSYYVYSLSTSLVSKTIVPGNMLEFIKLDIGSNVTFALVIICAAAIVTRYNDKKKWLFYLFFIAGFVFGVIPNRIIWGGVVNSVIPAFIAIAILTGLALPVLQRYLRANHKYSELSIAVVYGIIILLFISSLYDPRRVIPAESKYAEKGKLIESMRMCEGEVFSPCYGYLPTLAGKTTSASLSAFYDILSSGDALQKQKLTNEFKTRIKNHYYSLIILGQMSYDFMKEEWVDVNGEYMLSPLSGLVSIDVPFSGSSRVPILYFVPRIDGLK